MLKPGALRIPLLLSVLLPALAGAGELYRYVNDKGVIVLDRQGVPPEYIGKGYDVLSDQGRVVRVVPPAPTADSAISASPQPEPDTSTATSGEAAAGGPEGR